MATRNPIASISYNTESFLREKLNLWISAHKIQAWQYILHKGEDGDKDHIHFRIEPNKNIDPMELLEELREYQFGNDKPLCCRPFRPSKEEDWFLYAVHDAEYLKLTYGGGEKCEKLPYDWHDIRVSDYYDLEVAFLRAKASISHSSSNLASRIREGASAFNLIMEGENPYLVSTIIRTASYSDYQYIASENSRLNKLVNSLYRAIDDYGLTVLSDSDGILFLSCADNSSLSLIPADDIEI